MIVPARAVRVVIATQPIDFRRGHDSLAAYAQNELKLDLLIVVLNRSAALGIPVTKAMG